MGKVRLKCPHCGKPIRVSDTAKKAKCPGCKKVIDVASAIAEGGEEAEARSPGAVEEETGEGEAEAKVGVAPPAKKPSKRASKRLKEAAAHAPARDGPTIAGVQSWMIVGGVSVVIFLVLWLLYPGCKWWAAIMMASAVGVYFDASLCKITRVGPGSPGSSAGPMIWGLIAFAFVVGPLIYILLRPKLLANSPEDIAGADMTREDLEETGKVRAPSPASPGVVLVLAGIVGLGMMFQSPEWLTISLGRKFLVEDRKVTRPDPRDTYDSKKPFHVAIDARKALDDGYKTLTWIAFPTGGDEETPTLNAEVDWDEEVAASGRKRRFWHWEMQIDEPGYYVLKVTDSEGGTFIKKDFRIRTVK